MTSPMPGSPGPAASPAWHADASLLASYAAGTAPAVAAWSVEAHLAGCGRCRAALSAHVDAGRLARNRSAVLVRAAIPDGRVRRLLCRCGVPDHVLGLLAATPSLRRSWLLSVAAVLAVVAGEAAALPRGWGPASGPQGLAGYLGAEALVPFLLVAPLLVLAGVAGAFLPTFDPASRLAVAAPFSGFTLLLTRTVCALAAALVPAVGVACLLPGPGWLPIALLLPSLALSAFAIAAATVLEPRAAAVTAGALWALPALLLAARHLPLLIVGWKAQFAWAAVLCACTVALLARRDRFEWGWMR